MNFLSRISGASVAAVALAVAIVGAANGQSVYSESSPYNPEGNAKGDKSKTDPQAVGEVTYTIPVSVFDKHGGPVQGVPRSDFSVFVDGSEIPVSSFEESRETNLLLLIDTSPSAVFTLETIQSNARDLIAALPPQTRVMVAEFNSDLTVRAQLTGSRAEALSGVGQLKGGDGTALYTALDVLAEKVLPLIPGRTALVLMTDGVDTTSRKSSYSESLYKIERSGTSVYPIIYDTSPKVRQSLRRTDSMMGIMLPRVRGPLNYDKEYEKGRQYLAAIAAATGGRAHKGDDITDAVQFLAKEIASKYYLTIKMPKTGNRMSQPLSVRVNRPGLTVNARGSVVE